MVRGVPVRRITPSRLAKAAERDGKRPPGMEPARSAQHYPNTRNAPFAGGAHMAQVEVESGTGDVEVKSYVVVHDAGVIINPQIVEAQILRKTATDLGIAELTVKTHLKNIFRKLGVSRRTELAATAWRWFESGSTSLPREPSRTK